MMHDDIKMQKCKKLNFGGREMKKRFFSMALACLMAASLFAGCSQNSTSSTDDSTDSKEPTSAEEEVTLIWYYPDDNTSHTKIVWEELNSYLKEKINTTIDYHPIEWGTYADKTNTVISSGQAADIIFCNATYFNEVARGAAQPIEEYLPVQGKEMYETLPEYIWESATVNGHIYGVPTYKDNAAVPGIAINKTVVEDWGVEIPESYETAYDLEEFFYELQEKRNAKYPELADYPVVKGNGFFTASENFGTQAAGANIKGIESFAGKGTGEQIFNPWATEERLKELQTMRKWVEDGIYPTDALNYDTNHANIYNGSIPAMFTLGLTSCAPNMWGDDYETIIVPSTFTYLTTDYVMFGSNIVSAKSENPDRAVAFLNLVNTDNYVANTLRFGVEGEYYKVTEDNRLDFTGTLNEDRSSPAYYKWYGWQFGNIFAMSLPVTENDSLWDELQDVNLNAYQSENLGFVFDPSSVTNEITTTTAIVNEYYYNLINGVLPDPEASLNEMNERLEASGNNKIIEEMQKQLNEWRSANGKSVYEP